MKCAVKLYVAGKVFEEVCVTKMGEILSHHQCYKAQRVDG